MLFERKNEIFYDLFIPPLLQHSQKIEYYYSYIGSYLKAVRAIAEIWNNILYFYSCF